MIKTKAKAVSAPTPGCVRKRRASAQVANPVKLGRGVYTHGGENATPRARNVERASRDWWRALGVWLWWRGGRGVGDVEMLSWGGVHVGELDARRRAG